MGKKSFTQEAPGKPAIVLPAHSHWPKIAKNNFALWQDILRLSAVSIASNMRIPFSSYQAMHLPTGGSILRWIRTRPRLKIAKLWASLKLFPESDIADPSGTVRDDYMQIAMATALISAVYLLALISFLFLMKYMIDQNRRLENIVYSIVGPPEET